MDELKCDILILGAGPAGLSAALAAASRRRRVIVLDDNPLPGGQIWRDGPGVSLAGPARRCRQAVEASPYIRVISGAKLIARPTDRQMLYETARSCGIICWHKLILCCGARELSLPFPGWTLPGVTGAGGLQAQIKHGLTLRGENVVIAGSGPLLLAVASTVRRAGGNVVAIAEQASLAPLVRFGFGLWRWPEKAFQMLKLAPQRYRTSSQIIAAWGEGKLRGVTLRSQGTETDIECDRLAIGYGLVPNLEPGLLFGCELRADAIAVNTLQQTSVADIFAAGECTGFGGSELAIAEGNIAGFAAAENSERAAACFAQRAHWQRFADALNRTFHLPETLKEVCTPETLLCRCEDVACGEVAAMPDWRSAKLATRCGMGACQGRTCAAAGRWLYGWPLPAPREPLAPARLETLLQLSREK